MPSVFTLYWSSLADLSDLPDMDDQSTVGDALTLNYSCITGSSDVTGYTMAFTLAPSVDDAPVLTLGDSSFSGKTSGGAFAVAVLGTATQYLPGRNYYWEVRRTDVGFQKRISFGYVTLAASPSFTPVTTPNARKVELARGGTSADLSAGLGYLYQASVGAPVTSVPAASLPVTAHAASHAAAGSDPVTIAESQVTGLTGDLAAKVPTSTTVNGHALSGNVTVTKSDVGLGSADDTSDANKPVSNATQTALDAKVAGPSSATDTALAVFDGTTGKLVKNSATTINAGTGAMNFPGSAAITANGIVFVDFDGTQGFTIYSGAQPCLATGNRTLIATDGSTARLDWSGLGVFSTNASAFIIKNTDTDNDVPAFQIQNSDGVTKLTLYADGKINGSILPAVPGTIATTTDIANAVTGLLDDKGPLDCSANPNYPVGVKGDCYHVTAAGKVGGASGVSVDIADVVACSADNAGGTQASVGASWYVLEHNLVGALLAGNNLGDLTNASTARTNLVLGNVENTALSTWAGGTSIVTTGTLTTGATGPGFTIALAISTVTGTLGVTNGGTGITSFGTGVATFLATPTSANLAAALTDETGTGPAVFATSPTFTQTVNFSNTTNNNGIAKVFARDDGANTSGVLVMDRTNGSLVGTLIGPQSTEGVVVNTGGSATGFGDYYIQYYSSGDLIACAGGGVANFGVDTSGVADLASAKLAVNGGFALDSPIYCSSTRTTVNGSTSGSVVWSQSLAGASLKKVAIYCNALLGTATVTFAKAFAHAPHKYGDAVAIAGSPSTTAVTLTGATTTGWVFLEGF